MGQFADNLQADILLPQGLDREELRTAWTRNFGYPLKRSGDDEEEEEEGAFKSDFHEFCDAGGAHLDFMHTA